MGFYRRSQGLLRNAMLTAQTTRFSMKTRPLQSQRFALTRVNLSDADRKRKTWPRNQLLFSFHDVSITFAAKRRLKRGPRSGSVPRTKLTSSRDFNTVPLIDLQQLVGLMVKTKSVPFSRYFHCSPTLTIDLFLLFLL